MKPVHIISKKYIISQQIIILRIRMQALFSLIGSILGLMVFSIYWVYTKARKKLGPKLLTFIVVSLIILNAVGILYGH